MTPEARRKYVEEVINSFIERIQESKVDGVIEFMAWLRSPEGAIVYGYLWRPEYVEVMKDIALHVMNLFHRFMILMAIEQAKKG